MGGYNTLVECIRLGEPTIMPPRAGPSAEQTTRARSLGHGPDFVIGFRAVPNLDIEVLLGAFVPGAAFDKDRGNAYVGALELQYKF